MDYTIDSSGCFADSIGEAGLAEATFQGLLRRAIRASGRLSTQRASGEARFLCLPGEVGDLQEIETAALHFRESFDSVLVIGTGGSSLGARSLARLARPGEGPRLAFLENVDPLSLRDWLEQSDLTRCGVLSISKSGGTAETLAQTILLLDHFREALGEAALPRHFLVLTERRNSPLSRLAERFSLPRLDHLPDLGGRFSVLSNVGLLPATIAGLDCRALRAGAAEVMEAALAAPMPEENLPAVGAAVSVGLAQTRRIGLSVMMPYSDRLQPFSLWYRQLWAESLGKAHQGTTPISALGTVDQHSQLQLYLDGPRDKLFTFLEVIENGGGPRFADDLTADPDLAFLGRRGLGELMNASLRATAETLTAAGRPVRCLRLKRLDEHALGSLFMHFMLETVLAADLFGVDPYDQPAVENGKRLVRQYLAEMTGEDS